MITIDKWYESKVSVLKAKGNHRHLQKMAPLDSFVMLVRSNLPGKLMPSDKWNGMYEYYLKTGKLMRHI